MKCKAVRHRLAYWPNDQRPAKEVASMDMRGMMESLPESVKDNIVELHFNILAGLHQGDNLCIIHSETDDCDLYKATIHQ